MCDYLLSGVGSVEADMFLLLWIHLHLQLRIHKRDSNVANSCCGWQAFVVVSEAARVHQRPAFPGSFHGAVVPQEPAAAALQQRQVSMLGDAKDDTIHLNRLQVTRPECTLGCMMKLQVFGSTFLSGHARMLG